jgi:acetyl esterase
LQAAGVPVLLRQYADLNHGFFSFCAISASSEAASNQLSDDLRQQLLSV